MDETVLYKNVADVERETWDYLYKKYPAETVRRAAGRVACGCATCTKILLETGRFRRWSF